MIMIFNKNTIDDNYKLDFRRISKYIKGSNQVYDILNGFPSEGVEMFHPTFSREKYLDKTFTFNDELDDTLLTKIVNQSNFKLDKKEIIQGIVPNPDYVNSRNIKNIPEKIRIERKINIGDGVFIVDNSFSQNLNDTEKKYIKPVYEPFEMNRYTLGTSQSDIIYINKSNFKSDCPMIISHLEKYREIMNERRENQNGRLDFYHLHWSRDEEFFKSGPKILSVRKCMSPTFVYTELPTYVMMSVNVIKSKRINLKYLTGLLNSNLMWYYFKRKGKLQGENFQIDSDPILESPLYKPEDQVIDEISEIVDTIIMNLSQNLDITTLENRLNKIIYKVYNLSEQDIITIENDINQSN